MATFPAQICEILGSEAVGHQGFSTLLLLVSAEFFEPCLLIRVFLAFVEDPLQHPVAAVEAVAEVSREDRDVAATIQDKRFPIN